MKKAKTSGAKPAKRKTKTTNTKPAHKTSKKTTGKCSSVQKNSVKKAVSTKQTARTGRPPVENKIDHANELRKKVLSTINASKRIVSNWTRKKQGAPANEQKKIDQEYGKKFEQADKRDQEAYREYYDFVHSNFSEEQIAAAKPGGDFINQSFIDRLAETAKPTTANKPPQKNNVTQNVRTKSHVGEIHRGNTKYIDKEPKKQRNYAVVKDKAGKITVAKVKTIKKFDEQGKNADNHLQEIDKDKYGLKERSGVDHETFSKNRMSKKPLRLEDKDVFPEKEARAKLSSKDTHKVLVHIKNNSKKKK